MSARRRSFFGWGYEDEAVPAEELGWFERAWSQLFHVDGFDPAPMPRQSEITLRTPRVLPPPALRAFCTTDKYDRLLHCYGRSVHDLARMIHRRDFTNPPDAVAYPRNEGEIGALLDWCGENDLAAIPFGGGSSVVGGVNPPADGRYRGTVTIDLKLLNRVLEIDGASQAARVQGGVLGPTSSASSSPAASLCASSCRRGSSHRLEGGLRRAPPVTMRPSTRRSTITWKVCAWLRQPE